MAKKIKLGYEIGSGKKIEINPSHLLVTGLSQKAGKTTALESFIKRSGSKAIVFRTKVGEKSFLDGTIIPPFFKSKSDWRYIESLIGAVMHERIGRLDRAFIIKLSKKTDGESLSKFKKAVDDRLLEKTTHFENLLLTNLQAYLEIVIPKLESITFSNTLELTDGLNIIDLERFARDPEVQSLIIASVLEEVLYNHKGVIILIPEAWKFIPQSKGNPCKRSVEEFIRQGATNRNYIWIDSQDMTGVDKSPLKQISEWILGYQSEKNEVKHTLDQIPLPKATKPKEDEIMQLPTGHFIFASRDLTTKIYVQPFWLSDEKAIAIATGKMELSEINAPEQIDQTKTVIPQIPDTTESSGDIIKLKEYIKNELKELREDNLKKFNNIQDTINKLLSDIAVIKNNTPQIDEDEIISKVLQKTNTASSSVDIESLTNIILSKIPKATGTTVYEVAPIEKIKKDFISVARTKIINDIEKLSPESKQLLKYLESRTVAVATHEICKKCFLMKDGNGSYAKQVIEYGKQLMDSSFAEKQTNGRFKGILKNKITEVIAVHEPTDGEIDNLYNHILMELLEK